MTGELPEPCGSTTYVCRACQHIEDFIPAYCILRVPEFEGFVSTSPTECPYRMTIEPEWEPDTLEMNE